MPGMVCLSIIRYYYRFVLCTRDKSLRYAPMVSSYGNLKKFRYLFLCLKEKRHGQNYYQQNLFLLISLAVYMVLVSITQAMPEQCLWHPPRLTGTRLYLELQCLAAPDTLPLPKFPGTEPGDRLCAMH
jgi:hypothetical protein